MIANIVRIPESGYKKLYGFEKSLNWLQADDLVEENIQFIYILKP
jgi:hypothetical protein